MKKVLLISYNFPPVGGAGVQRPVKFVKYLRQFGWEPVVLTVSNPSVPIFDAGLLNDIPSGVTVYGARTLEPSYAQKQSFIAIGHNWKSKAKLTLKKVLAQIMLPDLQILWWPDLIFKLVKVIRDERPSILFVSAPPFSSFLPVVFIGRMFGVPVILDYRDEWQFSRNQWENAIKHTLAKRLDLIIEGYVVRRCAALTAANESYVSSIYRTYPSVNPKKGFVVTNGYDEDDFKLIDNRCLAPHGKKTITFIYTGTVWKATSLKNIITALKKLLKMDQSLREILRIKIFGRIVDSELECFLDSDLEGVVQTHGYIAHADLMTETMAADILLLTLSDLPGAEKIITGKAFEYMASGKHILAIVPEGETKDLLTENYNKLSLAGANDVEEIYGALVDIVANIESVRDANGKDVSHFSRRLLTSKLADIFNSVVYANEK